LALLALIRFLSGYNLYEPDTLRYNMGRAWFCYVACCRQCRMEATVQGVFRCWTQLNLTSWSRSFDDFTQTFLNVLCFRLVLIWKLELAVLCDTSEGLWKYGANVNS
jgi:hypothetical protein